MSQLWKDSILAKKIIKEKYFVHFIVILFVFLSVLGLKSFALRDWDEGVFALQGQWLTTIGSQGKPFNFQTPPLFQFLIAILFSILQINAKMLPLLSLILSCITIYLIYHLAKTLFSQKEGIYSIILFVTTEYFLFFSRSGLSDATFLCFFIASLLFFVKGINSNKTKHFLLAGLFTALALYTKYSAFPLLIMFFAIGLLCRKNINKKWFGLSILIPILLFLPYTYLFIRFVQISEISARHVSLLGINHLKFLFYISIFAPIPFLFSILYIIFNVRNIKKWDIYLLILSAIFILILGFYHPYFRLAYPLIPLLSIIASRFVNQTKKYKPYIVTAVILISLALSAKTLIYKSDVPKKIGEFVNHYARQQDIKYIYTVVPPNIDFYIDGSIVVPSGHTWLNIGKKLPIFMKRKKIIYRDNNELLTEEKILLIQATVLDSIEQINSALCNRGTLLRSIEFIDAPVYYKDIYNPQRDMKQIYNVYLFETKKLDEMINDFWVLGFDRRVTVIYREHE